MRRRHKRFDIGDHAVGCDQIPGRFSLGITVEQWSALVRSWYLNVEVSVHLGPWSIYYQWG